MSPYRESWTRDTRWLQKAAAAPTAMLRFLNPKMVSYFLPFIYLSLSLCSVLFQQLLPASLGTLYIYEHFLIDTLSKSVKRQHIQNCQVEDDILTFYLCIDSHHIRKTPTRFGKKPSSQRSLQFGVCYLFQTFWILDFVFSTPLRIILSKRNLLLQPRSSKKSHQCCLWSLLFG